MATTFSGILQPTNSTDALFRRWVQFVHDALSVGGWVQTADTGQINPSTVTAPVAGNTMQGYEVWRMDDSLQGSFPVFLKLEYGSGNGGANEPAVQITLGTGSNGSGTLTGAFLSALRVDNASNGATQSFSHSSGSPSHIAVALFVTGTGTHLLSFSIERARNSSGVELGTHLVVVSTAQTTRVSHSRYLVRAGGTQPTAQDSLTSIVTPIDGGTHTAYAALSDVSMGLILPISGASAQDYRPENPVLGYIVTPDTFTTLDATITVFIYGRPHVYKRLNVSRPGVGSNTNVSTHVSWQRYD
jgi:hypothetical protein